MTAQQMNRRIAASNKAEDKVNTLLCRYLDACELYGNDSKRAEAVRARYKAARAAAHQAALLLA